MHHNRPSTPIARGRHGAFTLIELLVVISIIIILLAVSIPTIRALTKGNNQKQAVNLMTTMLANARATAISTRKCSGIVVYEYPPTTDIKNPTQATSFIQLVTQSKYDGIKSLRYFTRVPGTGAQRLPPAIQVATLDMGVNAFRTQASDTTSSTLLRGANCRVILFDGNGQLLVSRGIATDASLATDPVAQAWNMSADTVSLNKGSSSPAFLVYDAGLFAAQHNASGSTDATWLRQNSDVVVVNAYTGNVIR